MRPFACWTRYLFTPQLVDATGTFQIHVRETPWLGSYKKATVALSDSVISTTPPAREVRWTRRLSCHRHRQQTAVCKTAWLPGDKCCVLSVLCVVNAPTAWALLGVFSTMTLLGWVKSSH